MVRVRKRVRVRVVAALANPNSTQPRADCAQVLKIKRWLLAAIFSGGRDKD